MEVPILYTDRLMLRPLSIEDANAVYVWVSDERVTRYMPYSTYTNIEDVKTWLTGISAETENYHFGFVLKENNLLIGSGDIGYNDHIDCWEFGYNLRNDYWNKGLATEAAKCMIKFAYDTCGARDFGANHAVDNPASGMIIEKCGLKFDKFGEYSKFDKSQTFKAKFYKAHLESLM